jgi:hypothetical protein
MNIYCPQCGEPWEIDTLHDIAGALNTTFSKVWEEFQRSGCEALEGVHNEYVDEHRAAFSAELMAIYGDDVDAVAADLADIDAMGWLD